MSYSLLELGASHRQQAMQGLGDAAKREQDREMKNEQLKMAEKQQKMSAVGMGVTSGAMLGAQVGSVGGPVGAAIGGAIGLIGSALF